MGKSRAEARPLQQRGKERRQGCPSERLRTSQRYKSGPKNRNAPAGTGAQFSTGVFYHNGKTGQGKNQGERKKSQKPHPPKTEGGAPAATVHHRKCGDRH